MHRGSAVALFGVSAAFHNLGPALAVLLFTQLNLFGVVWLRIAGAALVFALWRRPWRTLGRRSWRVVLPLGLVLGLMNTTFYLALARLPLATVSAVEFAGVVMLAAAGARTRRNAFAVALAVVGVGVLLDLRWAGDPLGFGFAFANLALFVGYVVLGHRIANDRAATRWGGLDQLGGAMLVAAVVVAPVGAGAAASSWARPELLLAGVGVGVCSSVIPYVIDQAVMAHLGRASFALLLSTLPAWATVIGLVVLAQRPAGQDLVGIGLVVLAVALHQNRTRTERKERNRHGTGTSRVDRAEGLPDLPRHDELRGSGRAGLDAA